LSYFMLAYATKRKLINHASHIPITACIHNWKIEWRNGKGGG
jgi:hypothetical protein